MLQFLTKKQNEKKKVGLFQAFARTDIYISMKKSVIYP